MGKVKFSIIMPVYNVEKYIRTAVNSVLSQTYDNFEIILVDDASPDNCPAICDEYAEKYNNVKCVHHSVNHGLSAVRNTGLQYASGEYVSFMDTDDYIDSDLLETVNSSLEKNPADSVAFGMKEEYYNKNNELCKTYEIIYGSEDFIAEKSELRKKLIMLEKATLLGYSANKFYKKEIILKNALFFEEVPLIEDFIFNAEFFENAASLNILNTSPYHYMKRIDGSLTNRFVKDYYSLHRRRVTMLTELYKKWGLLTDGVRKILGNIYARYIFSALQRNCDKRSGMNGSDRKKFLKEVFQDELFAELSPFIEIGGYAGLLYKCLKKQKTLLCLFWGRIIYITKEKMPVVFARAKQKR